MLTIRYQTAFKKDYKQIVRRGYDVRLLEEVITILAEQKPLQESYRDHNLSGDYIGCRECHITPDWLLIYEIKNNELVLCLTRIYKICNVMRERRQSTGSSVDKISGIC